MKIKKITFSGMILALSYLLPQAFHMIGLQQAGATFLPMHLPIFIGGMILGPVYGLFLGFFVPLLNMLLSGMPPVERVTFMMFELETYGLFSGLVYKKMDTFKYKTFVALFISMLMGRIVYAISLYIATLLFNIPYGGFIVVFNAFIQGLPGIAVQIVLVPLVVRFIEKGKYLYAE